MHGFVSGTVIESSRHCFLLRKLLCGIEQRTYRDLAERYEIGVQIQSCFCRFRLNE